MRASSRGDGCSEASAIIIHAEYSPEGVAAEYQYLENIYGAQDAGWELKCQEFYTSDDGRKIDVINIILANGSKKAIYFDITEFFDKYPGL